MRWIRRSVVVEGTNTSRRRASQAGVRVEGLERRAMLDCATTAYAAGALDPNFGNNGNAITPTALKSALVADVAIQKDGKIVEAGLILSGSVLNLKLGNDNPITTLKGSWFVARFNPDGKSLDPTFGQGGVVVTHVVSGDVEAASRVLLEPDGKLLVGGVTAPTDAANGSPVLVRYNTDGSLDTTFGSGGIVTAPLSVFQSAVTALALDGNTILVGGDTNINSYAIVRLNGSGTPDASFGNNGVASVPLAGPGGLEANDHVSAIAVGNDGTIDAAGSTGSVTGSNLTGQAIVVGFSDSGAVVRRQVVSLGTGAGGEDALNALAVEPDGTLVAEGTSTAQDTGTGSPPTTAVLARLNPDLSPDAGFGSVGVVRIPAGGNAPFGSSNFVVPSDGSIVALTGTGLARVDSAGRLDPTFGTNGVVNLTNGPTQLFRLTSGMGIDPTTGNYVVASNEVTETAFTPPNNLSVTIQPTLDRFLARPMTAMTPVFGPGTVHGLLVNAPKGRSFTHPVALVTLSASAKGCYKASDYRTTIFWGDGTSSRGAIVSGPFRTGVVGTHRYGHRGVYHTTIVVTSAATGAVLTTATGLIAAGVQIPHHGLAEVG